MKKSVLLIGLLSLFGLLSAQVLPGGNFEQWLSVILEYPSDANWTIYHDGQTPEYAGLLEKTSDASDGEYAIKFNTYGNTNFGYVVYGEAENGPSGGIPFADDPTQVTIAYKGNLAAGDSAEIWVWLFSGGEQLTTDAFRIGDSRDDYADYTFTLSEYSGMPDSLMFAIVPCDPMTEGIHTAGNVVYFDNVRFNGSNGIQIPDNSFEDWTDITLDYSNEMHNIEAGIEKSGDAYYGDYALKMMTQNVSWYKDGEDEGMNMGTLLTLWGSINWIRTGEDDWSERLVGGLPVESRKDTLVFYYKYIHPEGVVDTAQSALIFDKDSIEVLSYWHDLLQTDAYTRAEIPYDLDDNWTGGSVEADSMLLRLESTKWRGNWSASDVDVEGSSLYIDCIFLSSQEIYIGTEDTPFDKREVIIFPNPAGNILHIRGLTEDTDLRIVSLNGSVVCHYTGRGDVSLDVSGFSPGLYLIKKDDRLIGKFIKE